MHSQALPAVIWSGLYPERTEDGRDARDRQFWRSLATPFWSQRLALARTQSFITQVDAASVGLSEAPSEQLRLDVTALRRQFSLRGWREPLLARSFALIRETAHRTLGLRPHACQLQGGWAILQGMVAEMATGEGKTLTIAMAAATAALAHRRTHVITVNDYLVERDARELAPFYAALGLRVSGVTSAQQSAERAEGWRRDVVYCSNKTLAFDYLRDRVSMGQRRSALHREVDRLSGAASPLLAGLDFGIVDEADSVLIDECRTPLILSREAAPPYPESIFRDALQMAGALQIGEDFRCLVAERHIEWTPSGRDRLEALAAARDDFWRATRRRDELVRQALVALHLLHRDNQYIVRDGAIEIVDANTGRRMPERSWEMGLQQLVECKEGCKLSGANETISRITYQRFFGRYLRLGATSGTANEVASELWRVYGLRVLRIPRHRPSAAIAMGRTLHATRAQQLQHIVAQCRAMHGTQRPVLLGTQSVACAEQLSQALTAAGLAHAVLSARHDATEASIVAQAGLAGRITVATNMAGRGTDIKLGGGVEQLGGLHVIATEFNESERLDRQLFGRTGRQGAPGSYTAVLSLDDALISAQVPASARSQFAWLIDSSPRLARSLATALLWGLRMRMGLQGARQRRRALQEDWRIADALSFAGPME